MLSLTQHAFSLDGQRNIDDLKKAVRPSGGPERSDQQVVYQRLSGPRLEREYTGVERVGQEGWRTLGQGGDDGRFDAANGGSGEYVFDSLPEGVGDPYFTSRLQPGIPADYALLVVQNNNSAVESVE
jgi:hypothetical protein